MRHLALIAVAAMMLHSVASLAQTPRTVVNDENAKRMLVGAHLFSMQWVSWDRFGRATVTDRAGVLSIKGEQRSAKDGDFVTIDGTITRVDAKEFTFQGKIVTRVSYINGGKECIRDGEFTFAIKSNRRYWRLQQMDNPCEAVTDYVDVYFRSR